MTEQTIGQRVKLLRKALGKMSQSEFGARIKMTFTAVSKIELRPTPPTDRAIADICREFNVNEQWLRHGQGSMFAEIAPGDEIESWAAAYNLSELDMLIMRGFAQLSPASRDVVAQMILDTAANAQQQGLSTSSDQSNEEPQPRELTDDDYADIEEELAYIRQQMELERSGQTSEALPPAAGESVHKKSPAV